MVIFSQTNELFHLVSCIPQNEMVVLARDMNGHVGSNSVGYDGTHGGYGFGDRNAGGFRILDFADGLNPVICNTLGGFIFPLKPSFKPMLNLNAKSGFKPKLRLTLV